MKDQRIVCNQTDQPISFTEDICADDNFILWSLIPYIAACSGEGLRDNRISFAEVATIRPDGGHNLCSASVAVPNGKRPLYFDSMRRFFGPCWYGKQNLILWQIDSEWSTGRVRDNYIDTANRILSLLSKEPGGLLSEDDYAFLSENGVIKTSGESNGMFKAVWQVVRLANTDIRNELIAIGDRMKERYWTEFEAMKEPFIKAVLKETPKHLQKMQKFELQYIFSSDGWFVLHCLKELVNNGKLKPPTEEQKKSLTMMIVPNA